MGWPFRKRFTGAAACLLSLFLLGCEPAQQPADADFAVLARAAEGYATAQPGKVLEFPRDHGAHPDYRIEWWYLTANLEDSDGRSYGAQWTLFRTAVRPSGERPETNPWNSSQVFMAHFALTWPEGHRAWQRYARGGDHRGIARAGVTAEPFAAWLDDWRLESTGMSWLPLRVHAGHNSHSLDLRLSSELDPVLQGDQGFSQKHPSGGGSWYYSQPFLLAEGEITLEGERIPVSGQAWLDREWSSQFLQADQAGWDWFALHLDSGEKLMLFQLRAKGGDGKPFRHGVLISAAGSARQLESGDMTFEVVERTEVAGRSLPLHWRMSLPTIEREIEIKALHPEQWMDVDFPYWEGVIRATGEGPGNSGRGYMELTGYPANQ